MKIKKIFAVKFLYFISIFILINPLSAMWWASPEGSGTITYYGSKSHMTCYQASDNGDEVCVLYSPNGVISETRIPKSANSICLHAQKSAIPSIDASPTIEWVYITPQNISTMKTFYKQLESVYINAFKKSHTAFMQEEQPEKYLAMIKKGETIEKFIEDEWNRNLDYLCEYFSKGLEKIPVAVIKNRNCGVLGFSIFIPLSQNIVLPNVQTSSVDANLNDEVYVYILAVRPDFQRQGLGKKLLFSIFTIFPQKFKKMYLTTGGSNSDKPAHEFYEHCGFNCTAKYNTSGGALMRVYERRILNAED